MYMIFFNNFATTTILTGHAPSNIFFVAENSSKNDIQVQFIIISP